MTFKIEGFIPGQQWMQTVWVSQRKEIQSSIQTMHHTLPNYSDKLDDKAVETHHPYFHPTNQHKFDVEDFSSPSVRQLPSPQNNFIQNVCMLPTVNCHFISNFTLMPSMSPQLHIQKIINSSLCILPGPCHWTVKSSRDWSATSQWVFFS